jgi:hypothetical protein
VPAAEVRRESLFVAAESSQVDDASHPCALRCLAEIAGGSPVSLTEIQTVGSKGYDGFVLARVMA